MKVTLGTAYPTAYNNDDPAAQVNEGPAQTAPSSASTPAPSGPTPPAGYWVNPANPTQWLPPAQGSQVGNVCFFGTGIMPGRLRVGGNEANTTLYCGSFFGSVQADSLIFYGGGAALAFFLLPSRYKWWVSLPLAAFAVLGATLGGISI